MVVDTVDRCTPEQRLYTRLVLQPAANVMISVVAEMSNGMVHCPQLWRTHSASVADV
jgi:hypothetical protein